MQTEGAQKSTIEELKQILLSVRNQISDHNNKNEVWDPVAKKPAKSLKIEPL